MKVRQKVTHADGSVEEKEFRMEMMKGNSQVCWTLCVVGEPIAVHIIEAGWSDAGMKTYHVVTEFGDYEESTHTRVNREQLLELFPDFQRILDQQFQDVVISDAVIKSIPNDTTLGRHVRKESLTR